MQLSKNATTDPNLTLGFLRIKNRTSN